MGALMSVVNITERALEEIPFSRTGTRRLLRLRIDLCEPVESELVGTY